MRDQHIAHVNIATLRHAKGDARVQPFFDAVPKINALAERSPGFVWRLTDEAEEAKASALFGEANLAIAISVWENVDALREFVYASAHGGFLRQRGDWFVPRSAANKALWWVEPGTQPTVLEAKHRLDWLNKNGAGDIAFGFSQHIVSERTQ
ncbi:MAG: DUF3291 domain-containing protein [Pseudomonadota bacterium]